MTHVYTVVSFHVGRKPVVQSDLAESRYAGTSASTIRLNHRLSRIAEYAEYMQWVKCGIIPHATSAFFTFTIFRISAFYRYPLITSGEAGERCQATTLTMCAGKVTVARLGFQQFACITCGLTYPKW